MELLKKGDVTTSRVIIKPDDNPLEIPKNLGTQAGVGGCGGLFDL